jgi:hypothetical protein
MMVAVKKDISRQCPKKRLVMYSVTVTLENISIQWFNTLNTLHQAPVWTQVAKLEHRFLLGRHTAHVKRQI